MRWCFFGISVGAAIWSVLFVLGGSMPHALYFLLLAMLLDQWSGNFWGDE